MEVLLPTPEIADDRERLDQMRRLKAQADLATGGETLKRLEAEREGVREKSREFVGTFYGMMLQQMRASLPGNPLFDGGRGEEIFQQQMDNHLGDSMAQESRQLRLRDGTTRNVSNPLADQFAKSLSRSLDRQIDHVEQSLADLRRDLDQMGAPIAEQTTLERLSEATSEKIRRVEDLRVSAAGRSPAVSR